MKESSFEGTALLCFSYLCLKLLQTVCVCVCVCYDLAVRDRFLGDGLEMFLSLV